MTTAKQIKKLVQPLLDRNPDIVQVGRNTLWLRPVGSVGRLVLIDRTSNAEYCVARWHMTEFMMPSTRSWESLGRCSDLIRRSDGYEGGQGWFWSDPTIYTDIVRRVEEDAVATLRPLDTTRKCLEFARAHRATIGHLNNEWHLIAFIALGELEHAQALWTRIGSYYRKGDVHDEPYCRLAYDRLCLIGEPLMADDRAGLAALLHRWEAENIVGSPLEPYWVAERFPLENG